MPKPTPEISWVLSDPETDGQYLCGFAVRPGDGSLFKRIMVAVCRRESVDHDTYSLEGDVILDGMLRMTDLKFIPKKER